VEPRGKHYKDYEERAGVAEKQRMGFGSGLKTTEKGNEDNMIAASKAEHDGWTVGLLEGNKERSDIRKKIYLAAQPGKRIFAKMWKNAVKGRRERRAAKGNYKTQHYYEHHCDGFGKYFEHILKASPPPLSEGLRRSDEILRFLPTIYMNGSFPYKLRAEMVKSMTKFFATPLDEKLLTGLHHKSTIEYKKEDELMFLKELRPNKDLFPSKTNPNLE